MTADDIRGAIGVLPTPATSDAEDWRAERTVDLAETEKMVKLVVGGGIDMLMTTATFGEVATLTWPELEAFCECVIRTAAPHPVFVGVTTLNTRDTIARTRALVKLGAAGVFSGRPMFIRLTDGQIVRYYQDLAEALPGVPIIVYDNAETFRGPISTDVFRALATIPEVVAARQVGGAETDRNIEAVGSKIRFLPHDSRWLPSARKYPDAALACWSGNVACGPAPVAALSRAILRRDWPAAEAITDELKWAGETMYPAGDLERFRDFSIQLCHVRIRAAGLIEPGPCRPPYRDAPEEYVAGSEEVGRRWRQLHDGYS
jgi:4-(2-carboxyphenyl)-2-oxobut-3-enoate aldolase